MSAGYTVIIDVSERSLEVPDAREPRDGDKWFDWLNGKWFDTFAPTGPYLVIEGRDTRSSGASDQTAC